MLGEQKRESSGKGKEKKKLKHYDKEGGKKRPSVFL